MSSRFFISSSALFCAGDILLGDTDPSSALLSPRLRPLSEKPLLLPLALRLSCSFRCSISSSDADSSPPRLSVGLRSAARSSR